MSYEHLIHGSEVGNARPGKVKRYHGSPDMAETKVKRFRLGLKGWRYVVGLRAEHAEIVRSNVFICLGKESKKRGSRDVAWQ